MHNADQQRTIYRKQIPEKQGREHLLSKTNLIGKRETIHLRTRPEPKLVSMRDYILRHQTEQILDALTDRIRTGVLVLKELERPEVVCLNRENTAIGEMKFWRINQFRALAGITVRTILEGHALALFLNMEISMQESMTFNPENCGRLEEMPDHNDLWSLSEYMVPILNRERIEQGAEAMLAAFCSEALGNPMHMARHLAERLGLKIVRLHLHARNSTRSILFFKKRKFLADDLDTEGYEKGTSLIEVPEKTIVINTAAVPANHCQMEVNHECVHYYWHYAFYRLQDQGSNDAGLAREGREQESTAMDERALWDVRNTAGSIERNTISGKTPIDWIEWQASCASFALMLPRSFMQAEIDIRLGQSSVEGLNRAEKWEQLAVGIASEYEIQEQRVRIRLIQLGHNAVKGILNVVDGNRVRPFAFSHGACDHATFVIDKMSLMHEYLANPAFAERIDSGRFIYVDGHICLNDERYVRNPRNAPEMTAEARAHIDSCCLRFISRYEEFGGSEYMVGVLNDDEDYNRRYFSFVTAGRKLSEQQKYQKLSEVLNGMPDTFHEALRYLMKKAHITQETLEEYSEISVSTISRLCRQERDTYSLDQVVALCIAMKLPPWLSAEMLKRAGLVLRKSIPVHNAYRMVLNCMFYKDIDEIQEYLQEAGFRPLNLKTVA